MSTPHPADADRQTARDTVAAMPPAGRTFLEALHAEYYPPRADGGMPATPALRTARGAKRTGRGGW